MTHSCCAIKCMMLGYEFLLLSSHAKNSAANQRLQCGVSCWLCFLGQKGGGHKCIWRQYSLPGERKDTARITCMHTYVCIDVFSFYKICISSTNFKNTAPDYSTSASLAARLKTSSIISFYQLIILNLGGGGFSSLTLNSRRHKRFC